jgi:hypothetical protein
MCVVLCYVAWDLGYLGVGLWSVLFPPAPSPQQLLLLLLLLLHCALLASNN